MGPRPSGACVLAPTARRYPKCAIVRLIRAFEIQTVVLAGHVCKLGCYKSPWSHWRTSPDRIAGRAHWVNLAQHWTQRLWLRLTARRPNGLVPGEGIEPPARALPYTSAARLFLVRSSTMGDYRTQVFETSHEPRIHPTVPRRRAPTECQSLLALSRQAHGADGGPLCW
jgi:hypothetical protein